MADEVIEVRGEVLAPETSPAIILDAGGPARFGFEQDFLSEEANEHTRAAYRRAATRFLKWCERLGLALHEIMPSHVRQHIDTLTSFRHAFDGDLKPASGAMAKLHLTAIRKLFDTPEIRQTAPHNSTCARLLHLTELNLTNPSVTTGVGA